MFLFVGGGPYSIWITIFFLVMTSSDLLSYASLSWITPLAIGIGGAYLWSKWQDNYGNWNGQVIYSRRPTHGDVVASSSPE